MTCPARIHTCRLLPGGCRLLLSASFAWLLAGTTLAAAQSPDNGSLAQVFGAPVTASATGQPQLASAAPANIEIVTQDDIRRSGATTIPDALQFVPGVDVRRYGVTGFDVGIRGYNQPYNPRVLVLIDGREVYEPTYGHIDWAALPVQLDEIRQIEVIKGPNSALYGFNAVGGVINIITYDPLQDAVNTATLRAGTQSQFSGSAVGTARIGDVAALRLSAGGLSGQDYGPGHLDQQQAGRHVAPQVGSFAVAGKVRPAPGVELFAEASMGSGHYTEKSFAALYQATATRTNSFRLGGSADTAIGLISVSAYRNEEMGSISSIGLDALANWIHADSYVVQASDLMKLGTDHTLRLGLEYRNNAGTAPGFFGGTIGYAAYAASVMWNWQITPHLSLTNAIRSDTMALRFSGTLAPGTGVSAASYNQGGFTASSFNTGLVFEASEHDTVRLLIARGVQLPSLVDFGIQGPINTFGPIAVVGNPNLRPMIVQTIELDYDRNLPAWNSTLRSALFLARSDAIIAHPFAAPLTFGPTGQPMLLAVNVGHSEAIGGEIGLNGQAPSGLRWNASYAFVSTTNHTLLNSGPVPTAGMDYALSTPRHVLTGGLGYSRDRWELDLTARWQSSYRDFQGLGRDFLLQEVEIRNYITFNARIGFRLTDNVTLALSAQQFNTSRLYQTAGTPVERQVIGSLSAHF